MIRVKPGRASPARSAPNAGVQASSQPITYPAPVGGLYTSSDIAGQKLGTASVSQNILPTIRGGRVRGGMVKRGLAADGNDFLSSFKYKYGGIEKVFMATGTAIYDMTSPPAPPATQAATVSSMTSGYWTAFQHTNAGTSNLVCVNGTDPRQLYNGSTWTTSPAITFTDGTTSNQLNFGWLYKNREFFLKNGTLDAYYLGVSAIGGAASVFPLGGVMKKGGSLLMGFTWSLESGDGLSSLCVFVSTEGEVAVYDGDDPSSASTFALKGVYQIGKPLGKNAFIRAGADILVATTDGLTPISQVFQRDRQTLSLVSASRPIEDLWKVTSNAVRDNWAIKQWEEQNLVFISFPENVVVPDTTYVMNVLTGAWGIIRNWAANCYEMHQGSLYFGSRDGVCFQGDITGSDDGSPFSAVYLSQFSPAGDFGTRAEASVATMYFKGKDRPSPRLFARADMDLSYPGNADVTTGNDASSNWDVGLWDVARWDTSVDTKRYTFRQNVRASGDLLAVGCVITSSGDFRLDVELDLAVLQVGPGEASA